MAQLGGAERVAGRLARRFPDARLYTSVHRPEVVPVDAIGGRAWRTSFLQPAVARLNLKTTLPLMPAAIASLPLGGHDLVVSSSSAFAHHARAGSDAFHVCYCHTPPRFLWQSDAYFRERGGLRAALAPLLAFLRRLDLRAAARVDAYFAVSRHIASRIEAVYGRAAYVVHPPVDVASFAPSRERSGRFLVLSRLVASKRVELVVEAANRYELPLDVIGTGPQLGLLRRLAGPTVRVLGWQPDAAVREALATCEAAVIAGEEDFGLVTVEAQASGRPPIAFAAGGSLEIVENGVTGYLFQRQEPDAIAEAMLRASAGRLDYADLLASARRFDVPLFHERFDAALDHAQTRVPLPDLAPADSPHLARRGAGGEVPQPPANLHITNLPTSTRHDAALDHAQTHVPLPDLAPADSPHLARRGAGGEVPQPPANLHITNLPTSTRHDAALELAQTHVPLPDLAPADSPYLARRGAGGEVPQ